MWYQIANPDAKKVHLLAVGKSLNSKDATCVFPGSLWASCTFRKLAGNVD